MSRFGPVERESAVASLFRVRAAESPPDSEGLKQVWHQGAKGADLLSYVNLNGQVVRQEFTLFDDHFIWTPLKGLVTGEVKSERGALGNASSDEVRFDPSLSGPRINTGMQALAKYDGKDKYILHIRTVLMLAAEGIEERGLQTVTTVTGGKQKAPPVPAAVKPAHYLIGGGLLALGALALALVILLR